MLADAVGAIGRLIFDGGVPPAVDMHDVGGGGEVQSGAARLQRGDEDRGRVGRRFLCETPCVPLELRDHPVAISAPNTPV